MATALETASEAAAWLARNAVDSLPHGALEHKLAVAREAGRPLRVKLGIDPTAPDIHLGHTVVLRKLREFQDLGHRVVLIVGDFTARVGDPSGRSKTRPVLSPEEIDANARTFQQQAGLVLRDDRELLEVRRNGEWLDMSMAELLRLAGQVTVRQVLERDDFERRLERRDPISMLELLYPLLQGYDSVAVRADVELGGTDQKFNLLLARDIQRAYGLPEQAVLTMPLLVGTDGHEKMSKSLGNHIGVTEPAAEIYGKTMSVPDEALEDYWRLVLGEEPPAALGPRDSKRLLARTIVARLQGEQAAVAEERRWDRVIVGRELPDDVPVHRLTPDDAGSVYLPAAIAEAFAPMSRGEARRLIDQGGVSLDGETVAPGAYDHEASGLDGRVLKVGKRRFARLAAGSG
jgi:tyrosyl-tRNA synthetase